MVDEEEVEVVVEEEEEYYRVDDTDVPNTIYLGF